MVTANNQQTQLVTMAAMGDMAGDPLTILGLGPEADEAAVRTARRELARAAHPDRGGSLAAMQTINAAADAALRALAGPRGSRPKPKRPSEPSWRGGARDHPSFTIEALPVEAFEALMIVAGWHGVVADDDPPYHLSVALSDPITAWCQLDIVPDAGASTVSLTVGRVPGAAAPDVIAVRDVYIASLNQLDWADLDPNQLRPS